jgi:hypothetical protein
MPARSERVFRRSRAGTAGLRASDVDGGAPADNSALNRYFPHYTDGISSRPPVMACSSLGRRTARFMRFESAAARHALMTRRSPVPPSPAFETTARGAKFCDRIALVVKASPETTSGRFMR